MRLIDTDDVISLLANHHFDDSWKQKKNILMLTTKLTRKNED